MSLFHRQLIYIVINKLVIPRDEIFNFASPEFREQLAKVSNEQQMRQLVAKLKPALEFKPEDADGEFPTINDVEFEMVHLANFLKQKCQMPYQSKAITHMFNFLVVTKDDPEAYEFMYDFCASVLYAIQDAPMLSLQFFPMLGQFGSLSEKLNNKLKWHPKLYGIIHESSKVVNNMIHRETLDYWHLALRKMKETAVGANVKLLTSEFYKVPPEIYGNAILPWQKNISKSIPKRDLETMAQASQMFNLEEAAFAEADEVQIELDDDDSSSTLEYVEPEAMEDLLTRSINENMELREKTSADHLAEYDSFKGRKQFQLVQNMMYAETPNYSCLLRLGANNCPFFDDSTNMFCPNKTKDGCAFCPKHQSFETTSTMRTLKKLGALPAVQRTGISVAKGIIRPKVSEKTTSKFFQYCPSTEGALPSWKEMVNHTIKWLTGAFEIYQKEDFDEYQSFPFEL